MSEVILLFKQSRDRTN